MLSKEEKEFLELPQSQIAIKLEKKRHEPNNNKQTLINKIWSSRKSLLAISALIAGITPLYELNTAAVNYARTQIRVNDLLSTAESLLSIDAREATEEQLNNVRILASNNLRLQELQALLDLESSLRQHQDKRSLQTLEIKYLKILPSSARASYLLGTAYIGVDLQRAEGLLKHASQIRDKDDYPLEVKIESAWMWLYARRYNQDNNEKWLLLATEAFNKASKIASYRPEVEITRSLIPLYQHASFIEELRGKRGDTTAPSRAVEYSQKALSLAINTGSHLLIGKTSSGLAEKYKDAEELDKAKAFIFYAIENANIARDDRGIYHNQYTLGQIEFDSGNFDSAKTSFEASLSSSTKQNDMRMQVYNSLYLAKIGIVSRRYGDAEQQLSRSAIVAEVIGDKYGVVETKFLRLLLLASKSNKNDWPSIANSMKNIYDEAKAIGLGAGPRFWSSYLLGNATQESYNLTLDVYDKAFEKELLNIMRHR